MARAKAKLLDVKRMTNKELVQLAELIIDEMIRRTRSYRRFFEARLDKYKGCSVVNT